MLESATSLAISPEDATAYHELAHRLSRWLNDQEFTAQFTDDELDALSAVPGTWTPAQHEFLVEHGVTVGQGFLLARPMPAPALEAWAQVRESGAAAA